MDPCNCTGSLWTFDIGQLDLPYSLFVAENYDFPASAKRSISSFLPRIGKD